MFAARSIIFIPVFVFAVVLFLYNCRRIYSFLLLGKKEDRTDNKGERFLNVIKIAFGQSKLLREPIAGLLHFLIFWGFILFIFAVVEAVIQGFYPVFSLSFTGIFYSFVTVVQDLFGIFVIIAVKFAFYRRFIQKVERLNTDKSGNFDAALILSLILIVVLSMFGQNISAIAKNGFVLEPYEIRPISFVLSSFVFNPDANWATVWYEVFWWIHILTILGFMNFLPYSKHLHIITSIPNVYFAKTKKNKNTLKKLNLEDDSEDVFGASDFDQLTWKQIMDGFSCTECGRCTSVCPAAIVGKALSPRKIIMDIRYRTEEKAPVIIKGETEKEVVEKTLLYNYITEEELWACTTCSACVQECPVMIEHIDSIVDLRRYLVLSESKFPSTLNTLFKNLETNFSPWAFNPSDRTAWAEGLNIKTIAEDQNCDVLFWVGCAGSFDERYKKVSRAFSTLLHKAGVDFRILGTEEKCNGDTARRLGNEYLAQMLMQDNVDTLNSYGVKKIVTACPHCYHSLKNEFPQFGGEYDVYHHSEFLFQLISEGKLQMKETEKNEKLTYHDSCYLGRYNGIYDAPRNVLKRSKGIEIVEMERNKSRGFCCGAGGGRMFLEDEEGKRINIERSKEAIYTGATTIGTACPFCMTMLSDGVKSFEKQDEVLVKDIAEIILEKVK
ncbi:MAG TPA: (Fe-S)-binding protein [Ignavibacteriaceae bacterium]|nr:(Fe-S)-binding protein [Ignavibacteriaceae bacterium]